MADEKTERNILLAIANLDDAVAGLGLNLEELDFIRGFQRRATSTDHLVALDGIIRKARAHGL